MAQLRTCVLGATMVGSGQYFSYEVDLEIHLDRR